MPSPAPLVGALDQARYVGEHEVGVTSTDDPKVRMQGREGIVGDLRFGRRDRGEERRLAGVGQADEAGIGDQLHAQPDRQFLGGQARIGPARRLVGGRLKMGVAEATIATLGDPHPLARCREVGKQGVLILGEDLSARRQLDDAVFAVGPGAVLAHARSAALGFEMLLIAIVDQGVEVGDALDPDVAATATVATVRAAVLDVLFAPER